MLTCLVQQVVGLWRIHPSARDDLGASQHFVRFFIDGDDDHHDAFFGQNPSVTEHALTDISDDSIDVKVRSRHTSGEIESIVVQLKHITIAHHKHLLTGHTHGHAKFCIRNKMAVLTMNRHVPLWLDD